MRTDTLMTGPRIADRYEHIIKANPLWKLQNIKETVLLEMGADVSLPKIKRAKAIVMSRDGNPTHGYPRVSYPTGEGMGMKSCPRAQSGRYPK
ncbi:hypothetical protein C2845_PM08G15050 [Panicum miliaceum]|uniref:Uncharacterized protein n=1 Tax=Panicum miliaceum TaxID=4540 RepID=A0A3L6R0H7_PANMI|nr:hypothetical protein C2845_PM08G15050 [Panicum miliaceum]